MNNKIHNKNNNTIKINLVYCFSDWAKRPPYLSLGLYRNYFVTLQIGEKSHEISYNTSILVAGIVKELPGSENLK